MLKPTDRYGAATFFGGKLKILLNEKNFSITDVAKACEVSYSTVNYVLNGKRAPSLDFIFALSDMLHMPFENIIYLLFNEDNIKADENSEKNIYILKLNNGRGPTVGTILPITEKELKDFYGNDYVSVKFKYFLKCFLRDKIYAGKYEDYLKRKRIKAASKDADKNDLTRDNLLNSIITSCSDMEETDLLYVKEYIEFYKSHKKD